MPPTALASPSQLRPDEKPLAEYRAVSRAAVAAVGLGLASALVLITPLLGFVAVAAAVVAVLALRSIAGSNGQLVGRLPAIVGLSLAALFLGWGLTRHFSRQAALESAAQRATEGWLVLVQAGKLEEAHQLRMAPQARIADAEAVKDYYEKNAEARQELQSFKAQKGIADLVAAGPQGSVRYEGVTVTYNEGFSDQIQLRYVLSRPAERGGDLPLWISLARRVEEKSHHAHWEVTAITTTPPTPQ